MVLSGASFKMKTTLATDTVVGITRVKLLTAATIATWTLLFSGTYAELSTHKCYACGPEADAWFPDANSPPCENFTETDQFAVDCGDGQYCAITATANTHVVSRICSKNDTGDCTQNGIVDSRICLVCDGSLCNGILLAEELYKLHSPNKRNKTVEESKEWSEMTTIQMIDHNDMMNNETIVLTSNEEHKDTGIHILPEVLNHETVTSHSLPLPAALGQDSKQGAPVDDEEDTSEGSGNRIESDPRSNTPPPTTTEHITTVMTTTEQMKSSATTPYGENGFKLTLGIAIAYSLYF